MGLNSEEVASLRGIAPGVRAACDAYVRFVESHDLLESVASSLTELSAGGLMRERIRAFRTHYPWVAAEGLRYFESRTQQAPRDAREALRFVLERARGPADEARCLAALERKCAILWSLLDAVESLCRRPRVSPHAWIRRDARDGRTLVVLPERAVALNESGREIVELCDGRRRAEAIAAELRRRHPRAEAPEIGAHEFLAEMERLGVLEAGR